MMQLGLAIAREGTEVRSYDGGPLEVLDLQGYKVLCGFAALEHLAFEPERSHRSDVMIEVNAFSCNYRDKGLILRMASVLSHSGCFIIGSELAGRVLEVGSAVTTLQPGDRVMVNGFFGGEIRPWGLPTNNASRSLQVLPAAKLMHVPESMSDAVAAAFSVGAQTSFSMVRRAGVRQGSQVLVTAGTSNTSLFLVQAARIAGGTVSVTTTSGGAADRLRSLGASQVFVVEPGGPRFDQVEQIASYARYEGGFEAVLDPYFDMYLERAVPILASFGTYVTCGFERQFPHRGDLSNRPARRPVLHEDVLAPALSRNISIVANCLGSTSDLARAVDAFTAGELHVELDRDMGGGSAASFLSRTYCERERLGKVVYRYSPGAVGGAT